MSCGVSFRQGSDLELLWLWNGPEVTVLIQPLAWELLHAMDVALKKDKKKIVKKEFTHELPSLSNFKYKPLNIFYHLVWQIHRKQSFFY